MKLAGDSILLFTAINWPPIVEVMNMM
jgi:hypothetical protein